MKNKISVIIFLVFFSFNTKAQYNRAFGAANAGMGGTGVISTNLWSSYYNQAGLAKIEGLSVGAFFSNAMMVKDFGTKSAAFAMPVSKYGSFGLNYTYFGNSLYNESKFAFAYAKQLGKRISAGIQIDYFLTVQAGEYGKRGVAVGEIGILTEPIDNLYIGAHLFNPWRAKLTDSPDEYIFTKLRIGIGYNFSDKVLFTVEGDKDLDMPLIFRAGLNYNVVAGLFIRTGVSTNPTEYSFGAGYDFKGVIFDFSMVNHPITGLYPQFSLSYVLRKRKAEDTKNTTLQSN